MSCFRVDELFLTVSRRLGMGMGNLLDIESELDGDWM